jgi:hypothetical protein
MARSPRVIGETVRVRVDEAMLGKLPPVCAMTGEQAGGYAPMVVPRSLGPAWFLLVLGPVGWAILLGLYPRLRTRYEISVPMSDRAFDRWITERRRRLWCSWLGGALIVLAVAVRFVGPFAALVGLAGVFLLVIAYRAHWRIPWLEPSLSADARGRWVTMRGVHPRFVTAVARARRFVEENAANIDGKSAKNGKGGGGGHR